MECYHRITRWITYSPEADVRCLAVPSCNVLQYPFLHVPPPPLIPLRCTPPPLLVCAPCKWAPMPANQFFCALQDYATGSLDQNMRKRAVQLRELLTKLGPSFVKVGQALSSRPDLLPKEYLEVVYLLL